MALLLALAACDSLGGSGSGGGSGAKVAESGTKRGSAGGFSAQLSAELAKQNIEPASIAAGAARPVAAGSAAPGPGSTGASSAPPAAGSSASAGSAAKTGTTTAAATTGAATTGAATTGAATTGAATTGAATTGAATTGAATTGAANTGTANPGAANTAGTAAAPDSKAGPAVATPSGALAKRVAMKPNAEQAQIKLDLEPNWERDVGEAGTFSLVVRVPNGEERVFYARYGFEDQSAPPDCDSYRKFLEDKKVLTVTLNRQRGAACYIEGTDASGVAMYRYLLTYGGKRLMCSGSMYKDQASLGDLRDKVLMQAKKICETLAL